MSNVTGIMLLACVCDEDKQALDEVQEWLRERGRTPLADVSDRTNGPKHPQYIAMLGAGHRQWPDDEVAEFVRFVLSRDWYVPECLILTMKPEDGRTLVFRPSAEHYLDEVPEA